MTSLFLEGDPGGVFIFADYTGERGYLRAVVPFINSVGGAVRSRLEPMLLTKEIQETKRNIEVIVDERTSDLSKRVKLRPKAGAFGKVHCKEARY
ncbi:MAG TPA: hypothetical protein ENH07_04555 [Nitrospirae bacterium]|nr:hypothetical protein BMS3Abin08_02456 [bacterium BMS3Abin08]HDO35548.1 hypothetical protein [Nitrospirota bacterium]HDY71061.1 hypothetical protein [Nitrospirota bacterium]